MKVCGLIFLIWIFGTGTLVDLGYTTITSGDDYCEWALEACTDVVNPNALSLGQLLNITAGIPVPISQLELYCTSYHWMTMCVRNRNCYQDYVASKFGISYRFCPHLPNMIGANQCWDNDFPQEAMGCMARFYPDGWETEFYPRPTTNYSIADVQGCFAEDTVFCRESKATLLFHYLMPIYSHQP